MKPTPTPAEQIDALNVALSANLEARAMIDHTKIDLATQGRLLHQSDTGRDLLEAIYPGAVRLSKMTVELIDAVAAGSESADKAREIAANEERSFAEIGRLLTRARRDATKRNDPRRLYESYLNEGFMSLVRRSDTRL